jgi:hypothetical protein
MSSFPGVSNLEAQATIARAFKYANLLLNFATVTMLLFWVSLAPYIGSAVRIGHLVSVIIFPFLVLIWFSEYYWGLQERIDKKGSIMDLGSIDRFDPGAGNCRLPVAPILMICRRSFRASTIRGV